MIMPTETKRPLEEILEGDRLMPSAPPRFDPAPSRFDEPRDDLEYMRSISAYSNIAPSSDLLSGIHSSSGPTSGIHSGPSSGDFGSLGGTDIHNHPAPGSLTHPHSHPGTRSPPGGGGSELSRQDSAFSNTSSPSLGGASAPGAIGGGATCPNCHSGAVAPPSYRESLHHPIMHQQSHVSSYQNAAPGSVSSNQNAVLESPTEDMEVDV